LPPFDHDPLKEGGGGMIKMSLLTLRKAYNLKIVFFNIFVIYCLLLHKDKIINWTDNKNINIMKNEQHLVSGIMGCRLGRDDLI
jgi:hypothetical protein